MKGIIFNLTERIVINEYGEDAWDDILAKADVVGAYSSLGSYGDDEFQRIVLAASEMLDLTPDEIVRWIGQKAIPLMVESFPAFFANHSGAYSFVLSLNDIIHPEVRKLYPGADVPVFDFDSFDPNVLVVGYRSHRKMCAFAIGLIEGAAIHYGQTTQIAEPHCMHRGDPACELHIRFQLRVV